MSNILTLDNLQQIVHRLYEGNTSYPSSGEEDYELRTGFLNDGIEEWGDKGSAENIQWIELFADVQDSDGDKVTVAGQTDYDAPTDFIEPSSYLEISGVYYPYISPDKVLMTLANNSSAQFYYITGNRNTGYKININPAPSASNVDINYNYYKSPTLLSTSSDQIEMRKPYFAVYHCLAKLYELDNRNDLLQLYEQKKKDIMDSMIIANEAYPSMHKFTVDDDANELDGTAFGV